jgi:hypothetical protein
MYLKPSKVKRGDKYRDMAKSIGTGGDIEMYKASGIGAAISDALAGGLKGYASGVDKRQQEKHRTKVKNYMKDYERDVEQKAAETRAYKEAQKQEDRDYKGKIRLEDRNWKIQDRDDDRAYKGKIRAEDMDFKSKMKQEDRAYRDQARLQDRDWRREDIATKQAYQTHEKEIDRNWRHKEKVEDRSSRAFEHDKDRRFRKEHDEDMAIRRAQLQLSGQKQMEGIRHGNRLSEIKYRQAIKPPKAPTKVTVHAPAAYKPTMAERTANQIMKERISKTEGMDEATTRRVLSRPGSYDSLVRSGQIKPVTQKKSWMEGIPVVGKALNAMYGKDTPTGKFRYTKAAPRRPMVKKGVVGKARGRSISVNDIRNF